MEKSVYVNNGKTALVDEKRVLVDQKTTYVGIWLALTNSWPLIEVSNDAIYGLRFA